MALCFTETKRKENREIHSALLTSSFVFSQSVETPKKNPDKLPNLIMELSRRQCAFSSRTATKVNNGNYLLYAVQSSNKLFFLLSNTQPEKRINEHFNFFRSDIDRFSKSNEVRCSMESPVFFLFTCPFLSRMFSRSPPGSVVVFIVFCTVSFMFFRHLKIFYTQNRRQMKN
jgi:hypothetical protein